jgi:hypothetical protein
MVRLISSGRLQILDSVDIAAILCGKIAFFHSNPCNEMIEMDGTPNHNEDIPL